MAYLAKPCIDRRQVSFEWEPKPRLPLFKYTEYCDRGVSAPLTRDQVPLVARTSSSRKYLPDFILVEAMIALSRRVVDHIQKLEPGRNQYFPFTPLGPRRRPWLGEDGQPLEYYHLHITERFDSIDLERSAPPTVKHRPEMYRVVPSRTDYVMRSPIIGDHHVWGGIWHMPQYTYFSDTLGDWIIRNKMKGLRMVHINEVDS